VVGDFFIRNQGRLQINKPGYARNGDCRGIVIQLGRDEFGFFMKNGAAIADKFELKAPTLAKFEYLGPLNMFLVTFLADQNRQVENNVELVPQAAANAHVVQEVVDNKKVVQDVIDISSDEEVDVTSNNEEQNQDVEEVEDPYHFEHKVSAAMSKRVLGQPMVSYSNKFLPFIINIHMEYQNNNSLYLYGVI
jgi:hypothetical protein